MRQIDSVRSWILLAMLTFCLCAYPVRAEAGGAKAAPIPGRPAFHQGSNGKTALVRASIKLSN